MPEKPNSEKGPWAWLAIVEEKTCVVEVGDSRGLPSVVASRSLRPLLAAWEEEKTCRTEQLVDGR